MSTYSVSESSTFTLTHARHLAAKFAADLKRMQRFHGHPTDVHIAECEAELIELLKAGYLGTITVGFKRDGNWIPPTLRYTARDLVESAATDDDPGRVSPFADVRGATFYNYMTHNASWDALSQAQKDAFNAQLPFQRQGAPAPGVQGYFADDRSYSSGGHALDRSSVRSFG